MKTFDASNGGSTGTDDKFERFCRIREQVGLRAALAYLGTVTGYRRAAVIRPAEDDEPTAVAYFDREQPDAQQPEQWPAAVASAWLLRSADGSVQEARELEPAHMNSQLSELSQLQSEASACRCVPVIDAEGELHASLCVFDDGPAEGREVDLPLLLRVAASLAREGPDLTPEPTWSSAAGEEDPGSALDVVPSRGGRKIEGSSMSARQAFTSPLHET